MQTAEPAQLSVIIPTMASAERANLLRRAIGSVRASTHQPVRIIVVVNGARSDLAMCAWLQAQPDVTLDYVAAPSAPGAVLRGRERVRSEFFATLDDDDEYLPGTTERKIALLRADPRVDFLIANAYRCRDGVDSLFHQRLPEVASDPLASLMRRNWLTSGNAMFRSAAVGLPYFQGFHPYAEWTWLAFRLALDGKRIAILDEAVCRHHDTAISLSKSQGYIQSYLPLFQRMLERAPPPAVARMIRSKMAATHHDASVAALNEGRRLAAWRHHWHSLANPGGLQYLPYTRHLFK
jgi:glycosyltransferase involved in cell wall biosynthesis